MQVRVPSLRDHAEDIPFLAETFLQRHVAANQLGTRRFTREALRCLEQYAWPGNVRQLSHVIERTVILSEGEWIDVENVALADLPPPTPRPIAPEASPGSHAPGVSPVEQFNVDAVTRRLVIAALEKTRRHKGQAATLLGVHPRTLTRMLRRFGLSEG
jgi:DNA-binding NtrC family response regulator